MADQLVYGCIRKTFEIASNSLDGITKINCALYMRKDKGYPLIFRITKEKIKKTHEWDQNMAKMMTQWSSYPKTS